MAKAHPFSQYLNRSCLGGMGDSNLRGSYSPSLKYLHVIGAANNFLHVVNAGVDGDTSTGMEARFDHDILAWRPGAIYINAFTNDATTPLNDAKRNAIRGMITRGLATGAGVTLGTPPIVRNPPGDRPYLADHVLFLQDTAVEYGVPCFDMYTRWLMYTSGQLDLLMSPDGVHMIELGNQYMVDMAAEAGNLDCFRCI